MNSITYQKTVYAVYLIAIASVITAPDAVFGLLLELLHSLLEMLHLLFELFESTLDHIVEHIFHTSAHNTEAIVFYLMLSMAAGIGYYLWRKIPRLYHKLYADSVVKIQERKMRLVSYWTDLSLNDKVKLVALVNAGLICFILFGF